ncbi:MAG: ATP-dependent RecD-like DNA helicase, partial [Puniceicoccales bacterium]|nr:ATP-dependent RecD-like DNA helicase [Puniceicoccales bacterium]
MSSLPSSNSAHSETLTGVLERIVYFNEENHYTIGELRPENSGGANSGMVTVLGALPGVQCGETLELQGIWTTHKEHGRQFKIAAFRSKLPASVYGIRKYLGSGLVPGIGKTYAEKIVAKFGEDTLRIISEQSARLREVPGIGQQRVKAIKKAWDEQSSLRDVMVFLQTYGVTTGLCIRLVKTYGLMARQILETDPYKVAREIDGIGFRTADKIARNIGLSTEGAPRLEAGVLFALSELEEEGHTAVPGTLLQERSTALLEVGEEKIAESIARLIAAKQIQTLAHNGELWLQSPPQARAEEEIADCVNRLLSHPGSLPPIQVDRAVVWAQDKAGFAFAPAQAEAIRTALTNKFSILTGGPGTGKTTILSALCGILSAKKARIVLAAPTGRAAQRMSETTRLHASTIHRLLKFDPEQGRFLHDASNPLAADMLIVDEASMLDNRLAASLLRAVHAHTHLLLVGDVNQLPSVGPGNVLQDLIGSRRVPVTILSAVFRQGRRSHIVLTAHDILQGKIALPTPLPDSAALNPDGELQFVTAATPEACVRQVTELCQRHLSQKFGLDPWKDIQVLAPMHKGTAGIQSFNLALQKALKPAGHRGIPAHAGLRFEEGDKVIQTRNNYDKGVFNGDLGRITAVNPDAGSLAVDFDGTVVDYERADLGDLQLAYAITIHKSQGSEFNTVVIPLLKSHFVMLQRNLIYTAITRGRKRVILVGDPAAYA